MENEKHTTGVHIPEVSEEKKPRVGQTFETRKDAYNFYNSYAKEAGFSIRKDVSHKKKNTGVWTWKKFVCYKQGTKNLCHKKRKRDQMNMDVRKRGIVRCGCKAQLCITKNKDDERCHVTVFDEGHNHVPTTPSRIHLLRSQRKVSDVAKSLLQDFEATNVSTSQQVRLMAIQAGGIQNMGCTEKDIRNHKRDLREAKKGYDVMMLKEYFEMEQKKNSSFYFEFDQDKENRMTRVFWADPVARRAYNFFGDVVVFDITYNTNEFKLIFAPLTGVNHHGQTIIFGCAFLSDETYESFVWLFEQWLKVLPNGQPKVIITDQDQAMTKAIAHVLPDTFHRYCIWHIMNKFPEKLGPIAARDYYELYQSSVYDSETPEEFDASWSDALQESNLGHNTWLQTMYEMRQKWIPAYVKHMFSAGMSSSQRAESNHSFFKKYVDSENSLMLFVTRFNMALEYQRHNELVSDHIDINESPELRTTVPMEEQMRGVYTKKIFERFQEQIHQSDAYFPKLEIDNEIQSIYVVKRVAKVDSKPRDLVYDKTSNFAKCSCKHFDFEGIPCRHIVAFLRAHGDFYLPEQYVMQRWTTNARVGKVWDNHGAELMGGHKSVMMENTKLSHLFSVVVNLALLSEDGTTYLSKTLELAMDHLKELNKNRRMDVREVPEQNKQHLQVIHEPLPAKAKGSGKRLKSTKEKCQVKPRLCTSCGKRGAGHNKRKCPKLLDKNGSNKTTKETCAEGTNQLVDSSSLEQP